jgi:predicted Zn-dependent protease
VLGLARCRLDLHELDEAGRLLDGLLAERPDHVAALVERGRLALRRGREAEAEPDLRRACELAPHNRDAHRLLHLCLRGQGKEDEDRRVVARMDQILAEQVRRSRAWVQLHAAPHDVGLQYEFARVLLETGDEDEGVRRLKLLLRQQPDHRGAHAALAAYYERTGNVAAAARHWQALQSAGP